MIRSKATGGKKRIVVLVGGLILTAIVVLGFFAYRNGWFIRKRQANIPDVRGMSYDEAVKTISAELKKDGIEDVQFNMAWTDAPDYAMRVASQSPQAGTHMFKGDSITVELTIGQNWYSNYLNHEIRYELDEDLRQCFTQMPLGADAGEIVEIRTAVLTDEDIHVYVNGQEIEKTHYDSDYWAYTFTMPSNDAVVSARWFSADEKQAAMISGVPGMREAVIPDVQGLGYTYAVEKISEELAKAGIYDVSFSQGWVDGGPKYEMLVAAQSPEAGATVHEGDEISVYLYIGEGWYTYSSHEIVYDMEEEILQYFIQMPRSADAGEIVEIRTTAMTDADLHVYVNESEVDKTYSGSDYWAYTFPMPMTRVVVTAEWFAKEELSENGE